MYAKSGPPTENVPTWRPRSFVKNNKFHTSWACAGNVLARTPKSLVDNTCIRNSWASTKENHPRNSPQMQNTYEIGPERTEPTRTDLLIYIYIYNIYNVPKARWVSCSMPMSTRGGWRNAKCGNREYHLWQAFVAKVPMPARGVNPHLATLAITAILK